MNSPDTAPVQEVFEAVGIGRPVTEASMEALVQAFDHIAPEGVDFTPRTIPGINYVSADEMSDLLDRCSFGIESEQVPPLVDQIIASLCSTGKLTEAARRSVTMPVLHIDFRSEDAYWRSLQLRLSDHRNSEYADGYLMDGERTVFRQLLRQEPHTARKLGNPPKIKLRPGLVAGKPTLLPRSALRTLGQQLVTGVELGPIGVVTSV